MADDVLGTLEGEFLTEGSDYTEFGPQEQAWVDENLSAPEPAPRAKPEMDVISMLEEEFAETLAAPPPAPAPRAPAPAPGASGAAGSSKPTSQYGSQIASGIDQAVAKYNLPPEARAYLYAIADIESGFGRNTRGKAIGSEISGDMTHAGDRAMGPFQFMTKTAQSYGLKDRMDPYASADAAARHLMDAYKRQGSWHKAAIGHHSGASWKSLGKWGKDYDKKLKKRVGKYTNLPMSEGGGEGGYPPAVEVDLGGGREELSSDAIDAAFTDLFADMPAVAEGAAAGAPEEVSWKQDIARGAEQAMLGLETAAVTKTAQENERLRELADPNVERPWWAMGPERAQEQLAINERSLAEDALPRIAERVETIKTNPRSEAAEKFMSAKTWSEAWGAFTEAPLETAGTTVFESAPYALAALPMAANPLLGMTTLGLASGAAEGGSEVMAFLGENDINFANPDAVLAALKDPDLMAEARDRGLTAGAIIGAAEAVTAGIAGKIGAGRFTSKVAKEILTEKFGASQAVKILNRGGEAVDSAMKKALPGWKSKAAAGLGVGATGGAGGEVGKQLALEGEITEPGAIAAEILGEGAMGVIETGIGAMGARGERRAERQAKEEAEAAAQEEAERPAREAAEAAAAQEAEQAEQQDIWSQSIETTPEPVADERAAVKAVQDGRKKAAMVTRQEVVDEATKAGLRAMKVPNGVLLTSEANMEEVYDAEQAGERYKVLGYAEDKSTAIGPDAVVVRPVDSTGASPGEQVVSPENVETARQEAVKQAGAGGKVQVLPVAEAVGQREEAYAEEQRKAKIDKAFGQKKKPGDEVAAKRAAKKVEQEKAKQEKQAAKEAKQAEKVEQEKAEKAEYDADVEKSKAAQQPAPMTPEQKAAEVAEITPLAEKYEEKARKEADREEAARKTMQEAQRSAPESALGEPGKLLGGQLGYIASREVEKKRKHERGPQRGRQVNPYRREEYVQDVKGLAPLVRGYRDALKASDVPTDRSAPLLREMSTIAGSMAKLSDVAIGDRGIPHSSKHLDKLVREAGDVQARAEALMAEPREKAPEPKPEKPAAQAAAKKSKAKAEPKPEPKVTPESAATWMGLVEDDVLTQKQAIAAVRRGLTPEQAMFEAQESFAVASDMGEQKVEAAGGKEYQTPAYLQMGAEKTEEQTAAEEANKRGEALAEKHAKAIAAAARTAAGSKAVVVTKGKGRVKRTVPRKAQEAIAKSKAAPTAAPDTTPIRKSSHRAAELAALPETGREEILDARDLAAEQVSTLVEDLGVYDADTLIDELRQTLEPTDPYKHILDAIAAKGVGNVNVNVLPEAELQQAMEDPFARAGFVSGTNRVTGKATRQVLLSEEIAGTREGLKSLIHELVHASVNESLRTDNKLALEMERLRKLAEKKLGKYDPDTNQGWYGLNNVDEFLAESLTDAEFQRALADVKTGKGRTLWQELVVAVRNFLGLDGVADDSVLAHVLSAAPDLMLSGSETEARMSSRPGQYIADQVDNPFDHVMFSSRRSASRMPNAQSVPPAWHNAVQDAADRFGMGEQYAKAEDFFREKRYALGFMTTDQIVRENKGKFSSGSLTDYNAQNQRRTSIARKEQQKAEEINRKWGVYEKKGAAKAQELSALMRDTTMAEVDPSKPIRKGDDAVQYAKAKTRYGKLGADGQAIYREVRDFYQNQRKEMKKALLARSLAFKVSGPGVAGARQRLVSKINSTSKPPTMRDIDKMFQQEMNLTPDKAFADELDQVRQAVREIVKLTGERGPYFPLRRFGNYVASGMNDQGEPWVSFHETSREAREEIARQEKRGYKFETGPSLKRDWNQSGIEAAPQLLAQLKTRVKGSPEVQGQIEAAMIQLLSESSMRKSELERKNVEGASAQMRRAFAERAFAGSWALADTQTAFDRADAIKRMDEDAKGRPDVGKVAEEIKTRESKALSERKIGMIDRFLSKFGFLWYLASPSYAMVNATQVPLVAAPYLAAKYGAGKSTAALFDAYRVVTGTATQHIKDYYSKTGGKFWEAAPPPDRIWSDMMAKLNPAEQKMLQELQDKGIIDATFAQELFMTSKGQGAGKIDGTLNFARMLPQAVETLNRVVVAKAAYDVAPGDHAAKTQAAEDAIYQTQFDYSDQNKPRYFKLGFPGGRALMMFKMYAQGIYALTVPAAMKAMKGDKEAMKLFGGIVLTHSLAAGVLGGVFGEPLRVLEAMFNSIADEEDELDIDTLVRNTLADMFGAEVAEMVARGVPRGVGMDLSGRTGLNNLVLMNLGDDAKNSEEWYMKMIFNLLGPIAAAGQSGFKGLDALKEGNLIRAIQLLSPKFIRDATKSYALQEEGLKSRTGEAFLAPEDVSLWSSAQQAMGLQPGAVGEAWEERIAGMKQAGALRDKRDGLSRRWVNADTREERFRIWREDIVPFNRRNPQLRLEMKNLHRSMKKRLTREAQQHKGYYVDQKQRAWLEQSVRF